MQNKELLVHTIIHGFPEKKDQSEYQALAALSGMGGSSLSTAVAKINAEAYNEDDFVRLVDSEGNALVEGQDYIVTGGKASVAILDFKNQRVLRAAKGDTSKEEQITAINGMYDEIYGKIAQFIGFNVAAQAEAVGIMKKEKGQTKEEAYFGGSVMELAKGDTAKAIAFRMDENKETTGEQKQTINILKQARLLSDLMKMNVLDFITAHGDRNCGNYMINLNAGENESMVTAIDNDMLFGVDIMGKKIGHQRSEEALLGINDRTYRDFGNLLKAALPMMTQEVKDAIESMDIEAFNDLLMPYLDRVSRMAAIHRVKELKVWAKKVPTCSLKTADDAEALVKEMIRKTLAEWAKTIAISDQNSGTEGGSTRELPNSMLKAICENHKVTKASWGNESDAVAIMKFFGLSKEEAIQLLLTHASASSKSYVPMTMEALMQNRIWSLLENYDQEDAV